MRFPSFLKILVLSFLSLLFLGLKSAQDFDKNNRAKDLATDFVASTDVLTKVAADFQNRKTDVQDLRKAVENARFSYKKIQFLWDYFYPEFAEKNLNGAPLMQAQRFDTRPEVVPPLGMQVLDEMFFADEIENKNLVAQLAQKLATAAATVNRDFQKKKISEYQMLEAMRLEIVRVFSMGITGFDTPGSGNALAEARVSLNSLSEMLPPILATGDFSNSEKVQVLFADAEKYLVKNQDFDSFDRLAFYREHLQPIYRALLALQNEIPQGKPAHEKEKPWNAKSETFFSDDFLNPYFYAELSENEDNAALRELGKTLFHDPILSQTNQLSCASCHAPKLAFTDGRPKSRSIVEGETVERNSPTLVNAVYADRFFYDLRAFSLEQQAEHVIFNVHEFNTGHGEIIDKLNAEKSYEPLFKEAFGAKEIDREKFAAALSSFVLSLRSFNSDFDKYARGETDEIAPKVKDGFNLFMGKAACATCHFPPTFSGLVPPNFLKNETEILGVLESPKEKKLDGDQGRYENGILAEQAWIYEKSFKTPTVRNVELTAPYFHNGAYPDLESVVDFYDHGGGAGIGLEVTNQTLPADSLHLSENEKNAIVAFLEALTDNPF